MSEDLVAIEAAKEAVKEETAAQKWFRENPQAKELAEKLGAELAARAGYIQQLEGELEKLTGLFSTVIRLNGACRMKQEDLWETYEAISQKKAHLALIRTNGGELRAVWKHGPAPRDPVVDLVKKEQDLTDPED